MIDEKAKADGIRLSEVKFSRFGSHELRQIRHFILGYDLKYLTPAFIQDVADMVGTDVGVAFIPSRPVVMMKIGG